MNWTEMNEKSSSFGTILNGRVVVFVSDWEKNFTLNYI